MFDSMTAVFAMPKSTDEEKNARRKAMQEALKICTKTPMEMMEYALLTLRATKKILGKSNESALSDLGVSALSLKSAMQGAYLNVLINISSIKDENFVNEHKEKCDKILNEGIALADDIYESVKKSFEI